MRADDVLENAEDVGLEFLDVRAVEDRMADADHARTDVFDVHLGGRAGDDGRHTDQGHEHGEHEPPKFHGFDSNLREKCLLVKEKWPIVLTAIAEVCYRLNLLMPTSFSPVSDTVQACGTRVRVGLVVLELD